MVHMSTRIFLLFILHIPHTEHRQVYLIAWPESYYVQRK